MKILVVTLSNLGDAVLSLPVFQALAEHFRDASFHVLCGESSRPVFEGDPRIHKITVYNRRQSWRLKLQLLTHVRKERYDLIVDLRYSLIGFFGGAKRRNAYFFKAKPFKHRALRHLSALRGIADAPLGAEPFLRHETAPEIDALFSSAREDGRAVVVAAPGSKSDLKKWPAEFYARLLDRLASEDNCSIVLVGDTQDAADAARVASLMRSPVTDLTGKTDFRQLAGILKSASLLITNDSAPLHVADHFDTPVLALFGPTDPKKYGPRGTESLALSRKIFCSPCEKAQCRYQRECLEELGVDEVYAAAARLLSRQKRTGNPRILVIRLDRIGDLLLSLPALAAIRSRFPNARVSVMTRPSTAEILEGHPMIDEVIPYAYEKNGRHRGLGYLRFLGEITRRRFAICFILHPSVRSHLLPFLAGIPYRVGFNSVLPFLLNRVTADRRHLGLKHESEYTLDVVRAFGIEPTAEAVSGVRFFEEHTRKTKEILAEKTVAIHPGSSCLSKKWPLERYRELTRLILENTPFRIAVIGDERERPLGAELQAENPGRIADLTGRLSLKELAAFLSRCEVLVSNDSGPVHVAAAAGTRTLVIFGRHKPGLNRERWRPLGEEHRALQKNVGCVVCLADACTIDFECLKALDAIQVFEALSKMLSGSGVAHR